MIFAFTFSEHLVLDPLFPFFHFSVCMLPLGVTAISISITTTTATTSTTTTTLPLFRLRTLASSRSLLTHVFVLLLFTCCFPPF